MEIFFEFFEMVKDVFLKIVLFIIELCIMKVEEKFFKIKKDKCLLILECFEKLEKFKKIFFDKDI